MSGSDDWSELGATWRAQPVDLPRLRRETHWKTWRMRLAVASELAASLFLFGFMVWAWDRPDTTDLHRYWFALCAVALLPLLRLSLSARRGLWQASDDTVVGLLRLRIARARSGERLGWITIGVTVAMLVAASIWVALFEHLHPPADPAHAVRRLWKLAGLLLFCFAWIGGSYWYIRARRRERARWEALLREVGDS